MNLETFLYRVINFYEAHPKLHISWLEKLISGSTYYRYKARLLGLVISKLGEGTATYLENQFVKASRRDIQQTVEGEQIFWQPYQSLVDNPNISDRDIEIALMSKQLTVKGSIHHNMKLERRLAFAAFAFISMAAISTLLFLTALWSKFDFLTPLWLIFLQLGFLLFISSIMITSCYLLCYAIFYSGILPLATAYRLHFYKNKNVYTLKIS